MEQTQRKMAIVTSFGKRYSGLIDMPNENFRTTDLFNSKHLYWQNQSLKCYDNAVLMSDVELFIGDSTVYQKFDMIQIKLPEIVFLYDDVKQIADEKEQKRASAYKKQTNERSQTIRIITVQAGISFYDIQGIFYGLFKQKTKDNFLPLTQSSVMEIFRKNGRWVKKKIKLPHGFICINSRYIESVVLE